MGLSKKEKELVKYFAPKIIEDNAFTRGLKYRKNELLNKLSFIEKIKYDDLVTSNSILESSDIYVELSRDGILRFDIIDIGVVKFDLNKMRFILFDFDMPLGNDGLYFTYLYDIVNHINLYYEAQVKEWKEENERMNKENKNEN